jgi:hypothetical protein
MQLKQRALEAVVEKGGNFNQQSAQYAETLNLRPFDDELRMDTYSNCAALLTQPSDCQ